MKALKLTIKKKNPFTTEPKVRSYTDYAPSAKHVPVIFFGPKDFDDWKLFERKANKYLSQFEYIQGIVTLDQRTHTKTTMIIHGCMRSSIGIGVFGELYSIGLPINSRQTPPFRCRCSIFTEREVKQPIKRNKALFAKAKELSKKKPYALIFNDNSKEVKQFIKMCRKRNIKRKIIHLKED